jgi:glycosyltransferase involved in cell wall biosynthesis
MKISIITVCKNNKSGLMRAIECIRSQTHKNIEHIIVDGASTDGTVEILKQVQDDRLLNTQYSIQTISEPDNGIYEAINKGIKLATGDVIGLLHSDDVYADENVIEKYAESFTSDSGSISGKTKQIDAVYSDLVYVRVKSNVKNQKSNENQSTTNHQLKTTHYSLLTTNYSIIRNWKSGDPSSPQKMIRWLKNGWMPPHPTLFVRKEIFDKFGLYRTDLKIAADYEMILRLFYKLKIETHYLPLTTYLMTLGGASNKNLTNILQKSKEDFRSMSLNTIPFPSFTLFCKNIRKLPQFLR